MAMTLQQILAALSGNKITEINAPNSYIDATGAQSIADALRTNTVLKILILYGNLIGDRGAQAFAAVLANHKVLQSLNLGNNQIGESGAEALGNAITNNTALLFLYLNNNNIGLRGGTAIGNALLKNTMLMYLDLYNNPLGDDGARPIATALISNIALQNLALSSNQFGDMVAQILGTVFARNSVLQYINLSNNQIGPAGALAMSTGLTNNTVMQNIDLYNNKVGAAGAQAFANVLASANKALQSLSLSTNQINDTGGQSVVTVLNANKALVSLSISNGNTISTITALTIAGIINQNIALYNQAYTAAVIGNVTGLNQLLDSGISLNGYYVAKYIDNFGNYSTLLHHAANFGQTNIVTALLIRRALPTLRDGNGLTPCDIARMKNNTAILDLLNQVAVNCLPTSLSATTRLSSTSMQSLPTTSRSSTSMQSLSTISGSSLSMQSLLSTLSQNTQSSNSHDRVSLPMATEAISNTSLAFSSHSTLFSSSKSFTSDSNRTTQLGMMTTSSSGLPLGAILGMVFGILLLGSISAGLVVYWRRKHNQNNATIPNHRAAGKGEVRLSQNAHSVFAHSTQPSQGPSEYSMLPIQGAAPIRVGSGYANIPAQRSHYVQDVYAMIKLNAQQQKDVYLNEEEARMVLAELAAYNDAKEKEPRLSAVQQKLEVGQQQGRSTYLSLPEMQLLAENLPQYNPHAAPAF